jgi:hypothetical protein
MQGRNPLIDDGSAGDGGGTGNSWRIAVAVVLPVVFLGLIALRIAYLYTRRLQRLPDLINQQRKRALGVPRWGKMSLVVTDIQGYSDLMRSAPDQMGQVRPGGSRFRAEDELQALLSGKGGYRTKGIPCSRDAVCAWNDDLWVVGLVGESRSTHAPR